MLSVCVFKLMSALVKSAELYTCMYPIIRPVD